MDSVVNCDSDDPRSSSDDSDDEEDATSSRTSGSPSCHHHDFERNFKSSCYRPPPHFWNPSNEEVESMCDAFRKLTTATWFSIDMKYMEKQKWSNKCLQLTVLRLCKGQVRRHAQKLFNRRCANDVVSGSSSCQCVENLNAARDFL